jgi:hypothetical protein
MLRTGVQRQPTADYRSGTESSSSTGRTSGTRTWARPRPSYRYHRSTTCSPDPKCPLSGVYTGEKTLHVCHYRQRWRFEKIGEFLLKSYRSEKSLDPHRVCVQTLTEITDESTSQSASVFDIIHPAYRSAFPLYVYAKMLNFALMLIHPLLNALPLTLSLFLSLSSLALFPLHFVLHINPWQTLLAYH